MMYIHRCGNILSHVINNNLYITPHGQATEVKWMSGTIVNQNDGTHTAKELRTEGRNDHQDGKKTLTDSQEVHIQTVRNWKTPTEAKANQ